MFPWTLLGLSIYSFNSFKAPQIFIGSKTLKWKMPVTARCKAVEWVMCLSTAARPRIQVIRTGVWFRISESGVGMGRRISIWWNTHISLEPQTHSNTLRWICWQVQGKGKYKRGGSNRGGQQGSATQLTHFPLTSVNAWGACLKWELWCPPPPPTPQLLKLSRCAEAEIRSCAG